MTKKVAFAYLDAQLKQYPTGYDIYNDGDICCTTAGEDLIDNFNVSEDVAYEWSFEWAESKK